MLGHARSQPLNMAALRLVVMGVSGCGKSTVAQALAQRLGLQMVDGDDLHLPESVAKMRAGAALQDDDRWPWLDRIGALLALSNSGLNNATHASTLAATETTDGTADAAAGLGTEGLGNGCVVACSALRRAYRDRIRARASPVCFLFLQGDQSLIAQRLRQRVGHYMPVGLLDSQFLTLELPCPQETDVITLNINAPLAALVEQALAALAARKDGHNPGLGANAQPLSLQA